jgi:DNA-binding response OmpR family regulator
MPTPSAHVLVVEPNVALRSEIVELLRSEQYEVQVCDSLDQVVRVAADSRCDVALVAWPSMGGLLAEEHRHDLVEYVRRLHLVIMVGPGWAKWLDAEDLGGAHILEKPFDGNELLARIVEARSTPAGSRA